MNGDAEYDDLWEYAKNAYAEHREGLGAPISVPFAHTRTDYYLRPGSFPEPPDRLRILARAFREHLSWAPGRLKHYFEYIAQKTQLSVDWPGCETVTDLHSYVQTQFGGRIKSERILSPRFAVDTAELLPGCLTWVLMTPFGIQTEATNKIRLARDKAAATGPAPTRLTMYSTPMRLAVSLDGPMLQAYAWMDSAGMWHLPGEVPVTAKKEDPACPAPTRPTAP
jgi:hypothetical protein